MKDDYDQQAAALVKEFPPRPGPLDWLERFEMTDEEAEAIADPTWVEPGLIPEGHVVAVVAKPNGGKTTILFHMAGEIAKRGYEVVFVHADTNPSDAKSMREQAKQNGVRYLTPDMKVGLSMTDVAKQLLSLAQTDTDLTGQVWFFDTLKKLTNVINKSQLKGAMQLMRKLSSRGMTCVLLCHTNKYKDSEGAFKYEGTADLESDSDELIYFEPRENPDGSLTVSTRCEKRRADIALVTWEVSPQREVKRLGDYVDIAAEVERDRQRESDADAIEAITDKLRRGAAKQTEVVAHCRDYNLSTKRVRAVLKRYSGELWTAMKQFEKNAWLYELK